MATAAVIAVAALAGLAVLGGSPAPAPALPATSLTSLTTSVTTLTTLTTITPTAHTATLQVKGPGKVTSALGNCETGIDTPSGSAPHSCALAFDSDDALSFSASSLVGDDATFVRWEGGECDLSSSPTCAPANPAADFTLTAVFEDNTPPVVSIPSPAAGQLLVREPGQTVLVSSTATAADPSTVASCRFDFVGLFGPACQAALGDGSSTGAESHTVEVTRTDASGNLSAPVSRTFRVYILNTTISGPTGTVTSPPTFSLGSTKQGATFICRIDGGAAFGCPSSYYANLPDGTHTLEARSVHAYEGTTRTDPSPASRTFTIDRPASGGGTGTGTGSGTGTEQPVQCKVPKLRGKTVRRSKRALRNAHCRLGTVTRRTSATVRRGRVIKSRPRAGAKRPAGARVKLVVSKGSG